MKLVVLGLLAWLGLSVLTVSLVCRALQVNKEESALQDHGVFLVRKVRTGRMVPKDRWGHPVSKVNPVHPVPPVRREFPVHKAPRGQ